MTGSGPRWSQLFGEKWFGRSRLLLLLIDNPWLPNWAGHTILDYFTDEHAFLDDKFKAIRSFPESILLPEFWSEYGMCTEPLAFGSVAIWRGNEFPFPKKVLSSPSDVRRSVTEMLNSLDDTSRLIVSCGGGMPPNAPTENIGALISTVEELTR
jgi:Uroporphyrinogen decarboxylase (URO-D)